MTSGFVLRMLIGMFFLFIAISSPAQQTGTIRGSVTDSSGAVVPGVRVEARSDVLPVPRETVTGPGGEYRLPALPPGSYTVSFRFSGMQEQRYKAPVQLGVETALDVVLTVSGPVETLTVSADTPLIDKESATLVNTFSTGQIELLPVGQDYRDLQKLIPGIMVTEDGTRGANAGGSGQDNVYRFDGANVNLPFYGTLSSEPSGHDIIQMTVVKGGARAVDFDRAGGYTVNSVSKSGTSAYHGELSFQLMDSGMVAALTRGSLSRYEQDRKWFVGNIGGPVVKDRLFFYSSYYRPESARANRANVYGKLPDFGYARNEYFGKLTFTPSQALLLNASYRDSKGESVSASFCATCSATAGSGSGARQQITSIEGSWLLTPQSHLTAGYSNYTLKTTGTPDNVVAIVPSTVAGTRLDLDRLDRIGYFNVPTPVDGQTDYNTFIQPLIDRYGYGVNGVKTGGGTVGYYPQFNIQDFFRDDVRIGYNLIAGASLVHDIHIGFEWVRERERLVRNSNGWGAISVPGGRLPAIGDTEQPAYYTARIQQQSMGTAAPIRSEFQSYAIEFNDAIKYGNWTVNLGLLASQDILFGQGLREAPGTLSGYLPAPGHRYEMHRIPFHRMLQPRLGIVWSYNDTDTVYGSYARYYPAAGALPRAASWDRNLISAFVDVHFDRDGVAFASELVGSSSGKLFAKNLTPRTVDEFLIGMSKQFSGGWSGRLYARHRRGSHFWEDTENDSRLRYDPPAGIPRELYIPNLNEMLAQIGSGSTYVITELDGTYTRYYEAALEMEYSTAKTWVRGSLTWSRYYGNFDQDNTAADNDQAVFIGSSNIGDGAGRQLWNYKNGTLRGDRPLLFKLAATHAFPWKGSVGIFGVAQSGQPWEMWSYEPYRNLTSNTSSVNRYAEKAGSRRSDPHWQLDLNYTQNLRTADRFNVRISADIFNLFNRQTGYDMDPVFPNNATFGKARRYFDPRRLQVAVRLQF